MNAEGLPEKWRLRFQRDGNRCENNDGKEKKRDQRITLKNISGSFVVLVVGIFFSLLVFIVELILRRRESATVAVLTVAKTGDADNKIKSAAVKQPSPDGKVRSTDSNESSGTPDNESSAIVISQAVEPAVTELKMVSIEIPSGDEPEKALIKEPTADKVNIPATGNEEVIINAIQAQIIATKINEQRH